MNPIYYIVKQIRGEYAILLSDEGIENTVAMALLPMDVGENKRILWENFEYTMVESQS